MRNRATSRTRSVLTAVVCALAFIRCSSDSLTGPDNTATSATLDPPTASVRLGATTQLTAKGLNASSQAVTKTPTFTVSDPTVVAVNSAGLVRGIKIGTSTVTAAFGSVSASSAITVTPGYPASLTKVAGDNGSGIVQAAVPVAPSVQVKDSVGNPVDGVIVTFTATIGGGTVSGGSVTTNANGIATVGSWTLGSTVGANTLTASVQGATAAVTTTFVATSVSASATQLAVATLPAGGVTGSAFTTQPIVEVRTAAGTLVANSTVPVTVSASNGARLSGTTTVNAVNGVAKFTGLGVLDAGTQTLTFSSPGLTPAVITINVAQGPAIAAPATTVTGTRGLVEPDVVLVPVTSLSGAPISGLAISSVVYNESTQGWLQAQLLGTSTPAYMTVEAHVGSTPPGTYTANVTLTGNGVAPIVVPITFVVNGLPPTSIALHSLPQVGKVNQPFAVPLQVEFRDPNGQVATQVTDSVTVAVASGPGSIVGTLTVAAVKGVATFSDVKLTAVGTYTLSFGTPGLPVIFTQLIPVTQPATALVVTTPPAGTRNSVLSTMPIVKLVDGAGNTVLDETHLVTLTITGPNGGGGTTVIGTYTSSLAFGFGFFNDVFVGGPAGTYTFDFTSPGLATATVNVTFP